MVRAYVGLGANLGDRDAALRSALELLRAAPDVEVVAVSAFRETDPVGYADQPSVPQRRRGARHHPVRP